MDICEHVEENLSDWEDFEDYGQPWCGNKEIHNPHNDCLGIMCDYGCNAEYF